MTTQIIVSPGQETGVTNMFFSKASLHYYEKICSLDYLGIEERRDDSNYKFTRNFKNSWDVGLGDSMK